MYVRYGCSHCDGGLGIKGDTAGDLMNIVIEVSSMRIRIARIFRRISNICVTYLSVVFMS